jgi:hypothetical protein
MTTNPAQEDAEYVERSGRDVFLPPNPSETAMKQLAA